MTFAVKTASVSITANSTGTNEARIDSGKKMLISKLTFNSTSTFTINMIKNTGTGAVYNSDDLKSVCLKNDSNINMLVFDTPIELTGPGILQIKMTDTSGSTNVVDMAAYGDETSA